LALDASVSDGVHVAPALDEIRQSSARTGSLSHQGLSRRQDARSPAWSRPWSPS